jgi:hypothetical protein
VPLLKALLGKATAVRCNAVFFLLQRPQSSYFGLCVVHGFCLWLSCVFLLGREYAFLLCGHLQYKGMWPILDFWCCGSVLVFCFCVCGAGCFIIWFVLYLLLCNMFFVMFKSFSLASLGNGFVFNLLST